MFLALRDFRKVHSMFQQQIAAWVCCSLMVTACLVQPTTEGSVETATSDDEGARLIISFIRAYNGGDVNGALALVDERIGGNDCDYATGATISFGSKGSMGDWLRQRSADHDQLTLKRIDGGA